MKGLDKTLGFLLGVLEGFVVVIFVIAVLKVQQFYDCTELFENSIFFKFLGNVFNIPSDYLKGLTA